jgi:hypothetical protein
MLDSFGVRGFFCYVRGPGSKRDQMSLPRQLYVDEGEVLACCHHKIESSTPPDPKP